MIEYIFIYRDIVSKYEKKLKGIFDYNKKNNYKDIDKLAIYGLNLFLRDNDIMDDFKIDFILLIWNYSPIYMYAERTTVSNDNFIFKLVPIITIIDKNKFIYNDIMLINTIGSNKLEIEENIIELKIIDDGRYEFDDSYLYLLDNLPFNVEKIYLFYNIKKPINNLPFSIKKLFVYDNCDMDLIKIPFNCEVIKIHIGAINKLQ